MPIPSPFHPRTSALNESHEWRDWSGYLAAALYEPSYEREYYAIRNSAALIDVSPLFKYEISGPQALQLINRIVTRDISRTAVGQIFYTPWCDDDGKVIDDGTVWRLGAERFRITSADPNLAWFQDCGFGLDVQIEDISTRLATLALQGPNSRSILKGAIRGVDLDGLKYYRFGEGYCGDLPVTVSRTGYTGDLGYELWAPWEGALELWDRLVFAGEDYGIVPAGMAALDIARIEAGLVMIAVDYISSRQALIPDQNSSPFEIGLEWAVDLKKAGFIGRRALIEEQMRGPAWKLVGVDISWPGLEALFARWNLTPRLTGRASRQAVPVYLDGVQIGQITSHTFSPILKRYIGLASIESRYAEYGRKVEVEATVEYTRQKSPAEIVRLPFFNPARKRA